MQKQIHAILCCLLLTVPLTAEVEHKKAGDLIPDVQLRTADGTAVDLHETVAVRPSVLVFYRGGWCPFCTAHLAELGQVEKELRETGYQILALSPDRPEKIRESMEQMAELAPDRKITYTLLSDSKMKAGRAFGIAFQVDADLVRRYREDHGIDLEDASGETHHLLPHPAVFVVTPDKRIRFASVNTDYRERLPGKEILSAARKALAD